MLQEIAFGVGVCLALIIKTTLFGVIVLLIFACVWMGVADYMPPAWLVYVAAPVSFIIAGLPFKDEWRRPWRELPWK